MRLLTLPSAFLVALTGTAAGVFAGNSAIDSINPLFYSPLPSKSYASLTANRPSGASVRSASLTYEESRYALGRGCVGCRTYPEEYVPGSSYEQQAAEDYHAASLGYEADGPSEAGAQAPDPERQAVARYAGYQVGEQQAPAPADEAITQREDAEALRAAEERTVERGPEQLIY